MAKAFSIEDGNLMNASLVTSVKRLHSDIDCSFEAKPSGDIYKKTDAAAVKQAIKNLLMTNNGERPFRSTFGGNLQSLLFALDTELDESDIARAIKHAITKYEPRAIVNRVTVKMNSNFNSVDVTVIFQLVTTLETLSLNVTVARIR